MRWESWLPLQSVSIEYHVGIFPNLVIFETHWFDTSHCDKSGDSKACWFFGSYGRRGRSFFNRQKLIWSLFKSTIFNSAQLLQRRQLKALHQLQCPSPLGHCHRLNYFGCVSKAGPVFDWKDGFYEAVRPSRLALSHVPQLNWAS